MISVYSVLSRIEQWAAGYRAEHYRLGIQMGLCLAISLLPVLITPWYQGIDKGGSSLYTAITVAVVLEPSTGDSVRKLLLRVMGAGLSGGLGLLVLFLAVGGSASRPSSSGNNSTDESTYSFYQRELSSWSIASMAVLGFLFATHQMRYWRHQEFWSVALLTLPIVIVPAIRSPASYYYSAAAFRMLNVMLGIGIAAVISFVVLPVRARGLLQRKMASTLIKIGDLAVWLVGQACVLPSSSEGSSSSADIPGASGTDRACLYTDDGLRAKMAPLMHTASELTADLAHMGKLLEAASAEFYVLTRPHTFPTKQYRNLLESCHVVLGIFLSLIYSLQSNQVTLETCQRHISDLSEAGVRLSAAFTALSSLICPPKTKKPKKVRGAQQLGSGQAAAQEAAAPAAAAAACRTSPWPRQGGAVADGKQHQQEQEQEQRQEQEQEQEQQGTPRHCQGKDLEAAEDDPFAGLDGCAASEPGTPARAPVVELTDSELASAQVMARHLSQVIARRAAAPQRHGGSGTSPLCRPEDVDICLGEDSAPSSRNSTPLARKGSWCGCSGSGSAAASKAAKVAQQHKWVLRKLRALVDTVTELEAAAHAERQQGGPGTAGLASFMLVVHACVNITRQCGACYTALNVDHGAELHEYWLERRQHSQLQRQVPL